MQQKYGRTSIVRLGLSSREEPSHPQSKPSKSRTLGRSDTGFSSSRGTIESFSNRSSMSGTRRGSSILSSSSQSVHLITPGHGYLLPPVRETSSLTNNIRHDSTGYTPQRPSRAALIGARTESTTPRGSHRSHVSSDSMRQVDTESDSSSEFVMRPKGLPSLGNTCYMNSALQCILHTPGLIAELRAANERLLPSRQYPSQQRERAVTSLIQLFSEESTSARRDILKRLKKAAARYNDQFSSDQQNDAHEFLRTFSTVIHDEMNVGTARNAGYKELKDIEAESDRETLKRWKEHLTSVDDSVIYDVFGGMLKSRCECCICEKSSISYGLFLDLPIMVPAAGSCSLKGVLQRDFVEGSMQELKDDNKLMCSKCKRKQEHVRFTSVISWPKNLVLHLNHCSNDGSKITSDVPYPSFLMLSQLKYRLYAVCCHKGTAKSGHYTCVVSVDELHENLGESRFPSSVGSKMHKWFHCSDESVTEITEHQSLGFSSAAYLLLYTRVETR